MARRCTICEHTEREAINLALVSGEPIRVIASRFTTSTAALHRHKGDHLPDVLLRAKQLEADAHGAALVEQTKEQEGKADAHSIDVMQELGRCCQRVNLLFDACHRWLQDPDDPTRYDIGPRAEEVMITYLDTTSGLVIRKKAPLSELLAKVDGTYQTVWAESKHADPRELVLKTAERLQGHIQLLAQLVGKLQANPTMNIHLAPEWLAVRTVLFETLSSYPEARVAVADRLSQLEAGPEAVNANC